MATEIITVEDLEKFEERILERFKALIDEKIRSQPKEEKKLLKSHSVQRMLNISAGTLQNLRVNGTIPFSKVGGIIFYEKEDILKVLEENKRNI